MDTTGGDLLPGWTEHISPNGLTYYYNASTNQSQWDRPVAPLLSAPPTAYKRTTSSEEETSSKRVRIDSESDENGVMDLFSSSRPTDREVLI